MTAALHERFETALAHCFKGENPERLGIALSGGGDSTALLVLAARWAKATNSKVLALTVDHGLRPEAKDEAAAAAGLCLKLNIPHEIATWRGWDGQGNLQAAARRARYALLGNWARAQNLDAVALGHTLDDQAETFLMRLVRGSGVDGLAAMSDVASRDDIMWLRPLLGCRRTEPREFLVSEGITWADDPTNEDTKFDRIKTRHALETLNDLGLSAENLSTTANQMRRARFALEHSCLSAARALCHVTNEGDVEIAKEGFRALPEEIRLRLMAHTLCWASSTPYRPRLSALEQLLNFVLNENRRTNLSGCIISPGNPSHIRVSREPKAVAEATCATDEVWDNHWIAQTDGDTTATHIACLGANGRKQLHYKREKTPGDSKFEPLPAIWKDDELIAAPLAGWPNGWHLRLQKGEEHYFTSILSH